MTVVVNYIDRIAAMDACEPAVTWLREQQHPTLEAAWAACPRGDWLLWLAAKCGVDRRLLVRAAVACARTALAYTTDARVGACLDVVDRWCDGRASLDEVEAAAARAAEAAEAAEAAGAAAARAAAARAAEAAGWAAGWAAQAAGWAAQAAGWAAEAAGWAAEAAGAEAHARHADLVRSMIPCPTLPPESAARGLAVEDSRR